MGSAGNIFDPNIPSTKGRPRGALNQSTGGAPQVLSILKLLKVGEDAAIVVVLGTIHAHAITIKLNICPYCFNLQNPHHISQSSHA